MNVSYDEGRDLYIYNTYIYRIIGINETVDYNIIVVVSFTVTPYECVGIRISKILARDVKNRERKTLMI